MEHQEQAIETLLQPFRQQLGGDYEKYKNHTCRVLAASMLLDSAVENREKYAIAAAFHDIGIWTHHTLDYLGPSAEQAAAYLSKAGKADWADEIAQMIHWHHKMTPYKGENQRTVETFRKADWIDVSLGLMRFGTDGSRLRDNRKRWPNLGFHLFLAKGTFKNLLRHPLNPLPMFKK